MLRTATAAAWRLTVVGPRSFELGLTEFEALPSRTRTADRLRRRMERVRAAGAGPRCSTSCTGRAGSAHSRVQVASLEQGSASHVGGGRTAAVARPARNAPERAADPARPRLPGAADRAGSGRRAQHQVADPDRGDLT